MVMHVDRTLTLPEDLRDAPILVDRIVLRSPVERPDGAMLYEGVLARAETRMQYADGFQVATREALSSKRYLQDLVGISVVRQDNHKPGKPINLRKGIGRAVGMVKAARFDDAEQAVIVDVLITDGPTIADIEADRTRALSEGYVPRHGARRADGTLEQIDRFTNHIAVVDRPRNTGAFLRADEDDTTMITQADLDQLRTKLLADVRELIKPAVQADADTAAEAARKLAAEVDRANRAEAALAAIRKTLGLRADAAEADIVAADAKRVDALVEADSALLAKAAELGIKLPATSTHATRARDLAIALGADKAQVDAADGDAFARGIIQAAKPTAAKRHSDGTRSTVVTTPTRRS